MHVLGCVGRGGKLNLVCTRELKKLHGRPKAQHAGKAIGLTAHVIETAKRCRLRALTGAAAAEGSSRGSAGEEISLEGASGSLCQFHPRQTREPDPHRETYSWCTSVALVLLGTASDSTPLNWSGELQSREFLKRPVKTQQHNGQ